MRLKLVKSKELTRIRSGGWDMSLSQVSIHRAGIVGGWRMVRPELDESKELKKKGSEAVAADILRGWRIVRPELDESK